MIRQTASSPRLPLFLLNSPTHFLQKLKFGDAVITLESLASHTMQSLIASVMFRAERDNVKVTGPSTGSGSSPGVMQLSRGLSKTQMLAEDAAHLSHLPHVFLFRFRQD